VTVPVEDPEGQQPVDGNNKAFVAERINRLM